jgi:hypothetical protein
VRRRIGWSLFRNTATAALLACVTPAFARAQLPVDGTWQVFFWNESGPALSPFDSFGVSSLNPFRIRVTDVCLIGDQFLLSWTGTTTGSLATGAFGTDGDLASCESGDAAWNDERLSKGQALFAPGSYSFSLSTTRTTPDNPEGGAFIQAAEVPEPSSGALLGAGLISMVVAARRRRRA